MFKKNILSTTALLIMCLMTSYKAESTDKDINFKADSKEIYRIQNQFNGECLLLYQVDLHMNHHIYPSTTQYWWNFIEFD